MYTKEQFETLQKYEGQLYNALNLNYARVGEPNMIADLNRISKEVSNIEIIGGCSHCLMNHLKRLAKPYFEQKKTMEKAAELEKAKQEKNKTTNTKNNGDQKKNTRKGSGKSGGNKK
jgi:hypothetical protein